MPESQEEIELLKKNIGELSYSLEKLGAEKESLYSEKKLLEEKLSSVINSAKELKAQKATIDTQIRDKKQLRTTLNKEIKEFSKKISEVRKVSPQFKKGPNADDMKRQIEAMEYAIETEGLAFEREKTYMEKIKQLRAKIAEQNKISASNTEINSLRDSLSKKKVEADNSHAEIQKLADESTKLFNILTEKAKEIDELKQKRTSMQITLKNFKNRIEETNQQLAGSLNRWLEVAKTAPPITVKVPEAVSTEELFNKFKNAKKLTKEDILKLQRFAAKSHGHYNQGNSS